MSFLGFPRVFCCYVGENVYICKIILRDTTGMKRFFYALLLMAAVPVATMGQADAKLISKAEGGDVRAMVLLGECYEQAAGVPQDSALALQWFQRAMNLGDGEAALRVSRYYRSGTLLPHDTARFLAIRREWAEKGLPNALAAMHVIYEFGIGVPVDSAKAWDYLQQSVKKGSEWGYQYLGTCYAVGDYGLTPDIKKAVSWWQKAFKKGNYQAVENLVIYYNDLKDYKTSWKYLEEALRWGEPSAYMRAARMYYLGQGVEMDERKAQELIAKAARLFPFDQMLAEAANIYMTCDDPELVDETKALGYLQQGVDQNGPACMNALANYYAQVQQDYGQAKGLYLRIAEMKDNPSAAGEACYRLAYYALSGLGGEENLSEAAEWLRRGADEYKDANCAHSLASLYEDENYLDDKTQAVYYYRRANALGDNTALSSLGQLYANNGNIDLAMACFQEMVDQGDPEGYRWMASATNRVDYLETGAKKGSADCAAILGSLYEQGNEELGIKQDVKKSERYYRQSGTSAANYRLGRMYLDGELGKQKPADIAKGLELVQKSAEEGYIDAIYLMGYCYETGSYVDSVDHVTALAYYIKLAQNDVPVGLFKLGLYSELGDGGLDQDSVMAVEYYRRAADLGNGLAMCYLGDFYRIGQYLPLDGEKAFEMYRAADSVEEVTGTYYMARSYLEGCGVAVDTAAAIPLLEKSAALGVGNAAYRLGKMYDYGQGGLVQNADSAMHYYLMGHRDGSADASYVIGRQLLREGYHSDAVEYLYTAAKRGSVDGMALFAVCLQQGVGMDADPVEAYEILQAAVARGNSATAYEQLGLALLQGLGCDEDEVLGKRYLDTAAQLGSVNAELYVGLCYLHGWGCLADTVAAIRHLERAADNGNIRSINELGDVYEEQEDFKNAVLYYEKGVAMGSLESYCNLGHCYEQGLGVVLNSQKAYELYQVAADKGYIRGYLSLAQCHLSGIYVEESVPEAMKWLEKAAEAGSPVAMYYLGSFYAEGAEGVARDVKKAKSWYKKAAEAGYVPAQAALERLK